MNDDNNTSKAPETQKESSSFWEMVRYLVIASLIVFPFRMFIAQPYIVSGSSMDPTFENGDYLIVDQISKRFSEPKRESVLIIRYPVDPSKFFIKRLIGFPNETIEIKNGIVTIFNESHPEGFSLDNSYIEHKKSDSFSIKLGDSEYFVMGDNRANSSDSRVWGPLPSEDIVGKPILRLFPIKKIGILPGEVNNNEGQK